MSPGSQGSDERQKRGRDAESLVAHVLEQDGWLLLERNWRGGGGELDIVVRRESALRFVEVKERALDDWFGLEAVDQGKQRHLQCAARAWLAEYLESWDEACFMVVLVEDEPQDSPDLPSLEVDQRVVHQAGRAYRLTVLDNAFDT